ncbi:hypothetical protein NESM_000794300 [Novymonas esmeraldas]|uniref:Uncharacterized protein n=1 Tax=Novymonas esmeraldas TaxID=1808958 RepID=A0AAW0EXY9_9TRYP
MAEGLQNTSETERAVGASGGAPTLQWTEHHAPGAVAAIPSFSHSLDALRARLREAVRSVDDVMAAAGPATTSPTAAASNVSSGASRGWARAEPVDGPDTTPRRLYDSPPGRATAALALLRARQAGRLGAEASGDATAKDGAPLPARQAAAAAAARPHRRTDSGGSATYAAALQFWRADGGPAARATPAEEARSTHGGVAVSDVVANPSTTSSVRSAHTLSRAATVASSSTLDIDHAPHELSAPSPPVRQGYPPTATAVAAPPPPPSLPPPSSVATLSARLAALRASDVARRTSSPDLQWRSKDKEKEDHAFVGAGSALRAHDTGQQDIEARVGSARHLAQTPPSCRDAHSSAAVASLHPHQQRCDTAADRNVVTVASDPSMLVHSPPPRRATSSSSSASPAAEARRARHIDGLAETQFIVALAQQRQSALEEAWRASLSGDLTSGPLALRPPPPPPPPLLPPPPQLQLLGDWRGSAAEALQAPPTSSTALSVMVASAAAAASELEPLPMQAELAMRERLAARRSHDHEYHQVQPALLSSYSRAPLAVADAAAEGRLGRYEQLSESRDRDVAAHLQREVARQAAVQVAAQARVAQLQVALPTVPDAVTSAELFAIRTHAQQLERLRAETLVAAARSSAHDTAPAAGHGADVATDAPLSLSRTRSAATPPCNDVMNATDLTAASRHPAALSAPDAPGPQERTPPLRGSAAAADAHHHHHRQPRHDPHASVGERESTPEQATWRQRAAALESRPPMARYGGGGHTTAVESDAATLTDSHAEDWLSATQLPPSASTLQGRPQQQQQQQRRPSRVPEPASPSPVKPSGCPAATAPSTDRPSRAAPARRPTPSPPHAGDGASPSSPSAVGVSAAEDAERDLLSSSPSVGRVDGGGVDARTTARLASIRATRLHVSTQRGEAWRDGASSESDTFSSSSSVTSATPPRHSRRSTTRRAGSSSAPPARRRDVASPPRTAAATTASPLAAQHSASLQAHRRAVQRDVNRRTALRARVMLSDHGVPVRVQLAGACVPSLVRLSKDGSELHFYIDRVGPTVTSATPPLSSRSSAVSAQRFASPGATAAAAAAAAATPAALAGRGPAAVMGGPARPPPHVSAAAARAAPAPSAPRKVLVKMPASSPPPGRSVSPAQPLGGVPRATPSAAAARSPQRGARAPSSMSSAPHEHRQPWAAAAAAAAATPSPAGPATHVRELHHFPCAHARVYAPFAVMGYEADLGFGGPRTWEDVHGVLCGPACFEVLRRYRCPLFAAVRGPAWAPYRVFLIIPEHESVDVPQNAVLLVLDFVQRVDWVLFLLAMQREVEGGAGSTRSMDALSYGRVLWMLAAQRLHRARAQRGANPFDSVAVRGRGHGAPAATRPTATEQTPAARRGTAPPLPPPPHAGDDSRRVTARVPQAVPMRGGGGDGGAAAAIRGGGAAPRMEAHHVAAETSTTTTAVPAGSSAAPETTSSRFQLLRRVARRFSAGRSSTD